ncbi:hypothetical protein [Desulfoferrobacter suflitae]|uniref:hypothetical protein n=1 Tax=Desulfoferrobacter suflitae TaxID=2865782 RepID=UPI0021647329|nr:hypothetical protein [Desulfoferrobacter suflitae]MCK8603988.1 hypothetical protein [Desulfoferrobacter suflitae]
MKKSPHLSVGSLRGIAALFDDAERKEIFRKYLFFLGWVELLIFAGCFLYQLGDQGYDQYGPITTPFPWKVYFLLSFLVPLAITFLLGVIIVGFNKYFGEPEAATAKPQEDIPPEDKSSRAYKLYVAMNWLQRLPFLSLLLFLGIAVGVFYNLDVILGFIGAVGEKTVKIMLTAAAILLAVGAVFGVVLLVLNFKLRKKSMEYKYKADVAERYGLIILEDNTVLNSEGTPLLQGKNFKDVVPLLPDSSESRPPADPGANLATQTADLKST